MRGQSMVIRQGRGSSVRPAGRGRSRWLRRLGLWVGLAALVLQLGASGGPGALTSATGRSAGVSKAHQRTAARSSTSRPARAPLPRPQPPSVSRAPAAGRDVDWQAISSPAGPSCQRVTHAPPSLLAAAGIRLGAMACADRGHERLPSAQAQYVAAEPAARAAAARRASSRSSTAGRSGAAAQSTQNTYTDGFVQPDWQFTKESTAPGARLGDSFAYDPAVDKYVLFGGLQVSTSTYLSDTWTFCCTPFTWTSQAQSSPPSGRAYAAFSYVGTTSSGSNSNLMLMFGGYNGAAGSFGDTDTYNPSTNVWTKLAVTGGPSPRYGASLVYDSANRLT